MNTGDFLSIYSYNDNAMMPHTFLINVEDELKVARTTIEKRNVKSTEGRMNYATIPIY